MKYRLNKQDEMMQYTTVESNGCAALTRGAKPNLNDRESPASDWREFKYKSRLTAGKNAQGKFDLLSFRVTEGIP